MKMILSEKAVVVGIVAFPIFVLCTLVMGGVLEIVIPGGDEFLNGYFMPLYAGVALTASIVASCTYLVVKKINLLLEEIEKIKFPS